MSNEYIIREAKIEDAERLIEIYSYYVLNTAVSFEYEVPTVSAFRDRIQRTLEKYPYLVFVRGNMILGYAYAGVYSSRSAYDWTATTSIYVDKDYRREGVGAALYKELEARLKAQGVVNLLAGAAFCDPEDEYLSHDSYHFHKRMGYTKVAHMKAIGKKFDRWYDLLWMQKTL
ncbi:MAG: N-acetyltransferase [Clostridiales bacterium]|nr:N-acetyltransferase [Clostridiales bacterium]